MNNRVSDPSGAVIVGLSLFLVVVMLAVGPLGCGRKAPATTGPVAQTPPTSPAAVPAAEPDGKLLYEQKCIGCHGTGGRGDGPKAAQLQPKPADLTTAPKADPDEEVAKNISTGVPKTAMPAFKTKLTPEQIMQVVKYLRTLEAAH